MLEVEVQERSVSPKQRELATEPAEQTQRVPPGLQVSRPPQAWERARASLLRESQVWWQPEQRVQKTALPH